MKIFHLSDLHLGKRVNDFSMIEDQRYILREILDAADAEKPSAVIIAGDIYDKQIPPTDAVTLFDDFLYSLAERGITTLAISGNHDSAERIAFGGRLMAGSGVFFSHAFSGTPDKIPLNDEYGTVNFYLLPFIKPTNVRAAYPGVEIGDYTDALWTVLNRTEIDTSQRNILIAHQLVTGAAQCDSEDITIGGLDNVDADVFSDFDYVALGHIHGPQDIVKGKIRYCGTPLKYSFSEAEHKKSITVVEFGRKGCLEIREIPLHPLHDMTELRGNYDTLVSAEFYGDLRTDDYMHITLTDEDDVIDAITKLRVIYPNAMKLDYDNMRTRADGVSDVCADVGHKSPLELFSDLYEMQNGGAMSGEQLEYMTNLIDEIWGDKNASD